MPPCRDGFFLGKLIMCDAAATLPRVLSNGMNQSIAGLPI